jgi:DNA-binding HxlR family transcriptional regulator
MVSDTENSTPCCCPVARALEQVGDAWSMLILREAGLGRSRFDQFRTSLEIAPNILTSRLKALTEAGLLERRRYCERPPRDEYVLTERGKDFLPILYMLGAWSRRHYGEGIQSQLVDAETGHPIDPILIDRLTGTPIASRPVRLATPE